ncbi:MAG: hypothetical protein COX78_00995 [Candidatus Levybacteria bacterium CG_4_10_14_0_2_um_filter_35_8]|nr:MAG: hypothetical protein COW87_04175 [Candidatus Levybacteria bacterium CG22_combo_CG10-13_8_21_14_all_35_11]PIY94673.1 MAG: hypothetical protein COY68_02245 [Candidatus Levybacteria bacterium CG_4_10_14_0_8_um_filter_35_23]PJA00107.1 MAG: hypothetical protein COX78_00995 [Candidatus Levybacteria bacterium CG_4_10_14_0_2_um_filter_35_8]PJC54344.1 MAG: hypothetical protein CO028_03065 [Candidatus Levybacteria bacterium CG_4_9_14_0_2_um_filter_35_21]
MKEDSIEYIQQVGLLSEEASKIYRMKPDGPSRGLRKDWKLAYDIADKTQKQKLTEIRHCIRRGERVRETNPSLFETIAVVFEVIPDIAARNFLSDVAISCADSFQTPEENADEVIATAMGTLDCLIEREGSFSTASGKLSSVTLESVITAVLEGAIKIPTPHRP